MVERGEIHIIEEVLGGGGWEEAKVTEFRGVDCQGWIQGVQGVHPPPPPFRPKFYINTPMNPPFNLAILCVIYKNQSPF